MGQVLSDDFDDDEPVDSAEGAAARHVRRHAVDAKRIAALSWQEFVKCITDLNVKCKQMTDDHGKHLLFGVKQGSTDGYLWKATAQICCMKYNTSTKKVESKKIMNLSKFLRIYSSLDSILSDLNKTENSPTSSCVENEPTTSNDTRVFDRKRGWSMSLLMEKVDTLESLDANRQDSSASECIVCMERTPDVVLPCSHAYCLPCIEQWNVNNPDCPTCRADIHSTDEAWVISDYPDKREFTEYLLQLSE